MNAEQALEKLKIGNKAYLAAERGCGDISPAIRKITAENGQHPYAVIIACADSRVIPESIFSAGIGELFVMRAAGNTIDNVQLGSIEYATHHLGCPLVVVLGHTKCGAVDAALNGEPSGYVKFITDEIRAAIGGEKDDLKACRLNVRRSVDKIKDHISVRNLTVLGAIYHLESGEVQFLD